VLGIDGVSDFNALHSGNDEHEVQFEFFKEMFCVLLQVVFRADVLVARRLNLAMGGDDLRTAACCETGATGGLPSWIIYHVARRSSRRMVPPGDGKTETGMRGLHRHLFTTEPTLRPEPDRSDTPAGATHAVGGR
jgi:hypothetical protein